MKNLKKVIALIAVLALTLSTVALGATYSDVAENSAYSVAVESLSKLGIVTGYEDGTYAPDKAVTRAEMAALIARIQGYGETASAQTATVFTDVPADFWGSGYVAAASNMGIVNGYGDGTFGPDDAVKYEQAVTMIMRTLGYEPYAVANGGYPTGYLAAAQRYGLTKNVSNAVSGTDANRGTIAQLLYNGIDTPVMQQSGWGTDVKYTIYDGNNGTDRKTLMSENLGVVKVKGIVVANSVTGIDGYDAFGIDTEEDAKVTIALTSVYDTTDENFYADDEMISDADFIVGDTDIADALGYSVVAYVVEDEVKDDEYTVVSYAKDSSTNNVVEFTLDQFVGVATDEKSIEYYKNATDNKTSDLDFDKNGVTVVKNFDADTLENVKAIDATDGGKMTLIDNNSTRGYDVIIIEIGTSKVVDEATSKKIAFKEAGKITIDPEATNAIITVTKAGEVIAPETLTEWDVVTYVQNGAKTLTKVEVVGTTVVGKVSSTKTSKTSDDGYAYKIEGSFYDVSENLYTSDKMEIGAGGTFYVDKYGKIVAYNEDATLVGGTATNYALVINADITKAFGTTTVQIQLLTANGVDVYDVYEKAEINGKKETIDSTNAKTIADLFVPAENEVMLVEYNTNSNGEIKEISKLTCADFKAEYDEERVKLGSYVEEDAIVFLVTWDDKKVDSTETKIGKLADLVDGEEYAGKKFTSEDAEYADVIIVTEGIDNISEAANVAIITDIATEVVDGEDVLALSFYQDGELKENVKTTTKLAEKITDLTIGDIVKVRVAGDVITKIETLINFGEGVRTATEVLASEVAKTDGDQSYTFGYALSYEKKLFVSSAEKLADDFDLETANSVKLSKAANVYVIDAGGKSVSITVGDADDFDYDEDEKDNNKKDYVFTREYDGDLMDVVIIKAID